MAKIARGGSLTTLAECFQIGSTMNATSRAVREALAKAPGSLREIALRAGVPHTTLSQIMRDKREATPNVAKAIAEALDAIGSDCASSAAGIRRSLTNQPRRPE